MFQVSFRLFFVITLISQVHVVAGYDWLEFFDGWIFGSNRNSERDTHAKVLLEGENAENKYIENEARKISKPKFIRAQIEYQTSELKKWYDYYNRANFVLRYIASWAIRKIWHKREALYRDLQQARDEVDLEPFCHYRYLNNKYQTNLICRRVFQNQYFKRNGWFLTDYEHASPNEYKYCSRVTVSSIHLNEHDRNPKLSYYREARKCYAYLKRADNSSTINFTVYLISHENYLEKNQLAYFVLLNKDIAESNQSQVKKTLRYFKFWEEKRVQVAAYIENY